LLHPASISGQVTHQRRGASDCGEYRQAAGATNGATSLAVRRTLA